MSSEMIRLLVQQVAAFAGMFGSASARLMAAVRFLGTLTQPEIWAQVWAIVYPPNPAGNALKAQLVNRINTDPLAFTDEYAYAAERDAAARAGKPEVATAEPTAKDSTDDGRGD
jgi:hypothetical protein